MAWYQEWFGEEYLELYSHRDETEAKQQVLFFAKHIGPLRGEVLDLVGAGVAAVLGVVEGVTEFLPISSTGHLLVAANLLRFRGSAGGTFEIFIQFGAVIALLAFYARDLLGQAAAIPREGRVRRFWLCVLLAFLPAALPPIICTGTKATVRSRT